MILIDLNQVLLSGLMAQIANDKKIKIEEDLVRHMVLNILRTHIKNFKAEYGNEIVLCCDNRKYWRKEVFPLYKAGRKKARDKSDLDWHLIFDTLAVIKNELKLYFPYKTIDVEGAEADDIIGTLTPRFAPSEKVLILSSDGDFLQLQKYGPNVKQYNPSLKKYIKSDNPAIELKEKIIRGDKGDGIPNILSPGDTFARELRQKPITKGKLDELLALDYSNKTISEDLQHGFSRNQTLIDLTFIPQNIKESIIHTYDNVVVPSRSKLLNYFIEKKLKNLMDVIEEF
jgi:5'-3' exonuclease